jgi:hypothetical protein
MNDLLRPSFYNAYHQVLPINEKNTTGVQPGSKIISVSPTLLIIAST